MNAYVVRIPETRGEYPSASSLEPPEPWTPTGVFVAETPAQAKRDALDVWAKSLRSGVYSDDWSNLRVRMLFRDVDAPRGELVGGPLYGRAWIRVHEVLEHDGGKCDCDETVAA